MEMLRVNVGRFKTVSLRMNPDEFAKIRHLFYKIDYSHSEVFVPTKESADMLCFEYSNACWRLKAKRHRNREHYCLYGVSGDFSFGEVHGYIKVNGNIRAGNHVYAEFLKLIENKKGLITGMKFGL